MNDASQEVPFSGTEPCRFCPADGTGLEEPKPSGGARCPLCGRSWYRSSAPAMGATIVRDGKALVTVRAYEPEKGRVDVPGGFLKVGEHPVDGIVREVREELGVEIEVVEGAVLLAPHTYGRRIRARYMVQDPHHRGRANPTDNVAEIRWISTEEIDETDFAWEHDRGFVRAALEDA